MGTSPYPRHLRRALPAVAAAAAAAIAVPLSAAGAPGAATPAPAAKAAAERLGQQARAAKATGETPAARLGAKDVERLAEARTKGTGSVRVMVKTTNGKASAVAASLRSLGGTTRVVSDEVGYVSASIPTAQVEKLAGLAAVTAVDLDETVQIDDPKPADVRVGAAVAVAGPSAATPDDNPFMPTRDTGSTGFKKTHPTWDGRGVTIGIMDSGVDLDHPALQTTTTGERKIVDWVTSTDPVADGDGSWRQMNNAVDATPTFTYAGSTWTAPAAGAFRVNTFAENISAASEAGGDMNRDGDTTDTWGVLYDPVTNDIWVDADQDKVFTAAERMRPYKENFDVGHFGTDNPATAIAESMPFVVEFREDVGGTAGNDYVNIGVVQAAHGTHVAGIAAGHGLLGGAMDGQAPGAKVVSSRACVWTGGCTNIALTDGMVDLVVNRGVDVINMSIGGLPALNDGNNARAQLYNELIDGQGVQIVLSAGNSGPGVNTIGDPAVATSAISAGASITKATWLSNYGSEVKASNEPFNFSSRGPSEAGGFKPNIIAPGSAISSVPTWQPGQPVAEAGYTLPPGYGMLNGTSMASPQTAGVVALLLSAAEQKRLTVTPRQVRDAIYSSAVPLKNASITAQGAGLVRTGPAWQLLKAKPVTSTITSSAPVCTALSGFLATPGAGTGVYNRCAANAGGQALNQAKTYDVTLTRTTGPAASTTHRLRLVGNDGTFSAPTTVDLPLNTPTTVQVSATARSVGTHAAILEVDDAGTVGVDQRVMLTVMTGVDLGSSPFRSVNNGVVFRNNTKSFLVSVPPGTPAMQVDLGALTGGSQTRWIAINPYGIPVEPTSSLQCFANFSDPAVCNPTTRTYAAPLPGIWELEVESRRTSPHLKNTFSLTATALGVTFSPNPDTIASAAIGTPVQRDLTMTNAFGPVTVTPTGGALASARIARPTIADLASQQYQINVVPGSTQLRATIGRTSDTAADLDLLLYNCTSGSCVLAGQSADGDSEEQVVVTNPAAGVWIALVDGYSVPAGTTEYDYEDAFTNPALGNTSTTVGSTTLGVGASVPVPVTVTANAAPASGRVLLGRVDAVAGGRSLGSARIVVQSVQ